MILSKVTECFKYIGNQCFRKRLRVGSFPDGRLKSLKSASSAVASGSIGLLGSDGASAISEIAIRSPRRSGSEQKRQFSSMVERCRGRVPAAGAISATSPKAATCQPSACAVMISMTMSCPTSSACPARAIWASAGVQKCEPGSAS